MMKKTLAIATLSLIGLSALAPFANAAEEDVINDLENMLSTDAEEEVIPEPSVTSDDAMVLDADVEPEMVSDDIEDMTTSEIDMETPEIISDDVAEDAITSEMEVEELEMTAGDSEEEMTSEEEMASEEELEMISEDTDDAVEEVMAPEMEVEELEMTAGDSEEEMASEEELEVISEDTENMTTSEIEMEETDMMSDDPEDMMMTDMDDPVIEEDEDISSSSSWDYSGSESPDSWDDLSEDSKLCKTGEMQSAMDFEMSDFDSDVSVSLNYATTTFEVVNNEHSVQVNYPKGSTATIGDEIYNLLQFHFHTPSEHTVDGEYAEMEVHFIHSNDDGDIAVISSMIEAGAENYDVSKIWRNIPAMGESRRSGLAVNPESLLPESMTHATYSRALTTPPCDENVSWIVMAEPITLSQEQIETFQGLYPMDVRSGQGYGESSYEDYDAQPKTDDARWFY
ncbi:Carbonate dehydratase [[Leptolyngbya] sp. PCC 7376]|uniref:carbonic anhydrase n=1 Tax=[Leptolyngbya] sp. PCC 7376 TaxID=111781 RepID=UPI00029F0424|nr:carbonic anhydrase family protein [[Leptolyngbya] sp. PCC 7376]AFY40374.1 Carbonate dehydratase [[Leptolyngbya] sp. PCC 7376]